MKRRFSRLAIALLTLSITMYGCKKELSPTQEATDVSASAGKGQSKKLMTPVIFYALSGNTLDKYSTADPEEVISSVMITGLAMGETILGIDFRPLTGQLYALGSNSRLYVINTSTGVATFVAALTNSMTRMPLALEGSSFGFDFNPTVDRIRIVSNTGQNLRANPTTGATIIDGSINPQPASVNGVAYTNNDTDPSTATQLYALDMLSQQLFDVTPPNNGTLIEPVPVKLKITGEGGFDIAPRTANVTSDIALALYEVNKKSTLISINVETGQTTILAKYNKNIMYSGIAISPEL